MQLHIFLLLFFAFNSVKQGLIIYTAIPLSAIGGIFFLALRGMPFSISAGIGFIALFGVAVLNGIVLIAEFNRLKTSGLKNLNPELVSKDFLPDCGVPKIKYQGMRRNCRLYLSWDTLSLKI